MAVCKQYARILDGTLNTYMLGEISWSKDMPYYRAWIRGKFGDSRGTLYLLSKSSGSTR